MKESQRCNRINQSIYNCEEFEDNKISEINIIVIAKKFDVVVTFTFFVLYINLDTHAYIHTLCVYI